MPSRKCEDRPHLGPAKPIKGTIVDMSRFVNLGNHDPYRLFAAVLARSRRGMEEAFYAAFAADARCSQLMKEEQLLSISITPPSVPRQSKRLWRAPSSTEPCQRSGRPFEWRRRLRT
jgi:hypothetical protein